MAIWISRAAIGARITVSRAAIGLPPSSFPPDRDEEGWAGDPGDDDADGVGHRGDQDVAVLDVRQHVGQHPLQLATVEDGQDALGHRDRGVVEVAAGGEDVRLRAGRHVQPWHGDAGPVGQALDDLVRPGGTGRVEVSPPKDVARDPAAQAAAC
jgi:hypothetical protein